MNILHVNFARGFRGGERQTLALIQSLAALPGLKQTLLVRRGSELPEYLDPGNSVRIIRGHHSMLHAWKFGRHFSDFDVVHAHEAKAVKWAFWYQRFHQAPYIVTRRIIKSPKRNPLTFKAYARARHVVAISSYIQNVMQDYLHSNRSLPLIPDALSWHPVNQEQVEAIRASYPGKTLVGHVGALVDADKGQSVIVEAARLAKQAGSDFHFLLLGRGPDEAELKTHIDGLGNIELAGFHTDIGNWMAAFDYFVFPSHREGLGSSLLDAMAANKPVIASAVGGIPDIVHHEETGLLVPPASGKALWQALQRLHTDVRLRKRCIHNASEALAKYSPENIAQAYLEIYQS